MNNNCDKQYQDLLRNIIDNGVEKESGRENMPNTIGISHATIKMDLQEGFPLLTTKKMYYKGIIHELLWFLRGETNIKYLVDNKVNIWNGDAYRWYKERLWLLPGIENVTIEEFINRVKSEQTEEKFHYKYGDLGPVYGHNWRNYNGDIDFFHVGKKPQIDVSNHKTYGFGNKGVTKGVKKHFLFQTWINMIGRCYNYDDTSFSKYGGRGVYVSDDWLIFDKFKEDVKEIFNYDKKEKNPNGYQLDKDYLGGKYYSKETCVWMKSNENSELTNKHIIYTISNGKQTITTDNIEGTAKELNITPPNLNRVCNGIRKTVNGWSLVNKIDNTKGIDQIKEVIEGLQQNPYSRYQIIDGWNPSQRKNSALPPCHLLYQFIVRPLSIVERKRLFLIKHKESLGNASVQFGVDDMDSEGIPKFYLDLNMYQRSCDFMLGNPFNLASMSLLLSIIAKTCHMIPGIATWIGGDVHIYKDHIPMAKEQLTREPYDLCNLKIKKELNSLEDILSLTIDDFEIINYMSHPAIKCELFAGNKKR